MPNFYNSVKTFFRFYEDINLQSRYSNVCDDMNHDEYLLMYTPPAGGGRRPILPFQIVRIHSATPPAYKLTVLCATTPPTVAYLVTHATISPDITFDSNIEINGEYFDFISYFPSTVNIVLNPGIYYIEFEDGANTWYSELFEIINNEYLAREKDFCIPAFWTDEFHASESDDDMQELAAGKLT